MDKMTLNQKLMKAIEERNLASVKNLLAEGADIHARKDADIQPEWKR